MNAKRRICSAVLVIAMLCTMLPTAFAASISLSQTITLEALDTNTNQLNPIVTKVELSQTETGKLTVKLIFASTGAAVDDQVLWAISTEVPDRGAFDFTSYVQAAMWGEETGQGADFGSSEADYTAKTNTAIEDNTYYIAIKTNGEAAVNYGTFTITGGELQLPKATADAAIGTPSANGAALNDSGLATFAGTATTGTSGAPSAVKWALQNTETSKYWNGSTAFDSTDYVWGSATGTTAWTLSLASIKSSLTSGKTYKLVIHAQDDNTGVDATKLAERTFVYDNTKPTATWSSGDLITSSNATITLTLSEKLYGINGAASTEVANDTDVKSVLTVTKGADGTGASITPTTAQYKAGTTPTIVITIAQADLPISGQKVKVAVTAAKLTDAAGNTMDAANNTYNVTAGTPVTVDASGAPANFTNVYTTTAPTTVNGLTLTVAQVTQGLVVKSGATVLEGSWAWTNGSAALNKGSNTVSLTWTPADGVGNPYASATHDVTIYVKKELKGADVEATASITKVYDGLTTLPAGAALRFKSSVSDGTNPLPTISAFTGVYTAAGVNPALGLTINSVTAVDTDYYKVSVTPAEIAVSGAITKATVTISGHETAVTGYTSETFTAGDFISAVTTDSATGVLGGGDTITNLFATNLTGSAGVFTGNGVQITFYEDDTYAVTKTDMATFPSAAGTYYYSVSAAAGALNSNMDLAAYNTGDSAKDGELTLTPPPAGSSGYTVTYNVGEHGKLAEGASKTERVSSKKSPSKVPEVVANEGYEFLGWSLDGTTVVDPTGEIITKRTTFTALYKEEAKTLAFEKSITEPYIKGIEENGKLVFKPEAPMTRGEVAVMLARTLNLKLDSTKDYATGKFADLSGDEWYAQAVGYLAELGVMKGSEGLCNAGQNITRAEFVALVMRIDGVVSGENTFADVNTSDYGWAVDSIVAATAKGYIDGDGNGNFLPGADITRASVVKIMNNILGWTEKATGEMLFTDVAADHWAYNDIIKASTGK